MSRLSAVGISGLQTGEDVKEEEFKHILSTFPLVPDATKQAALNAYRDVAQGLIT